MHAINTFMRLGPTNKNVWQAVKRAYDVRGPSETVLDYVTTEALAHLVRQTSKEPPVTSPAPVSSYIGETLGLAWVAWKQGHDRLARELIEKTHEPVHKRIIVSGRTRGMDMFAFSFWHRGIEHLLDGKLDEGKRMWQRAIEVAIVFGSEASPTLQWTHAASFYTLPQ